MNKVKNIIPILKEVYPIHILLLAFCPIIIACLFNFDLFDSRSIIINLIWIPLFTIPVQILKKRSIYISFITLLFIIGLMELGHWIILNGPITTTSLLVISNTNFQESIEFFELNGYYKLLLLIPYIILFVYAVRHKLEYTWSKSKQIIVGIILIISVGFIIENAINKRLIRKGVPQIAKVTFSFIDEIKLYQEVLRDNPPKKVDAIHSSNNKNETVILVIGESCNKNHMSLYGAARNTTPKLNRRDDIIVFDNIVSPYSNTIYSIQSILSESNLINKKPYNQSIDLIDVFHSVGYKTYWISNQSPVGAWENLVTVIAKKSDHCDFVNTTSNSSIESTVNASYDSKILSPFETVLNENVNKKFIVIHLLGNHSSYRKRYPKKFDQFKGDTKAEKIIAEYDNSILYQDFILDSLIKSVELRNNESINLIYLSDHGENVYDEFDYAGHYYTGKLPKANVEIPFFLWTSSKFKTLYPEKITNSKSNIHLPYVSDDLFHSIMDLNNIKSPFLDKSKSIFSDQYDTSRKRILEDNQDYDK